MKRELIIDGIAINDESDCYVVAEIGNNHQGDIKKARDLITIAKECGAHAVKLQTRDNKAIFTKEKYNSPYDNPNSFGATYGAHREFLELTLEETAELQTYAKQIGITFFSTPWDVNSAHALHALDVPLYKISSSDLTNIPLIKQVAHFGKPMIISTGGGTLEDVKRAYEAIIPINKQLAILQCTATYPCEYEDLNLRVIETYRREFPDVVIGLSAHDSGIAMCPVAYLLGARIVEKHFTLNRTWKGTDQAASLEPTGLKKLVRDLRRTRIALGDGIKKSLPGEVSTIQKLGKKLVAARDIEAGCVLQASDIAIKSPADGIPPYRIDQLIGKKLLNSLKEDQDFSFNSLSPVNEEALS